MNNRLTPQQNEILATKYSAEPTFRDSTGGHMAYQRMLFHDGVDEYFVKAHDNDRFDDPARSNEMRQFLEKEHRTYLHARTHGYLHIPPHVYYDADMLVLSGLSHEQGWHWRAPTDPAQYHKYATDVVQALDALATIPAPPREPHDEVALDILYNNGWDLLREVDSQQLVERAVAQWRTKLRPESIPAAHTLAQHIEGLSIARKDIQPCTFNHHDARQANIAWHPKEGVSIVDWSWSDYGLKNGDTTMFLLDLHKSGHSVTDFKEYFNPTYAQLQLGYWLHRSTTAHAEGNTTVRFQQFVSALAASELLLEFL